MPGDGPKHEYSRAHVRRVMGLSERQLRSWERQGFIASSTQFSFSDLIALKTLQKLRESRIPCSQIGRALLALKKKLAHVERPLSELKIVCDGKKITVQIAGNKMEAVSGQLLFDFDAAELTALKSFPAQSVPRRATVEKEAEAWFEKGLALEETGAPPEQAIEAYERSVELNPYAAGALVNLGTICYRKRKFAEAETYYRKAIEVDAQYPLAHFNLGNLYDEQGNSARAQEYYAEALRLNPNYADAHFNLALVAERKGEAMRAVHHWKAYLKLDNSSSWAAIARRQLEKLRKATLVGPSGRA